MPDHVLEALSCLWFGMRRGAQVGKVALQVKALAATSDDPSSILETHWVKGKKQLLQVFL